MPELKISEAGSVQFPMVAHAAEIGWTPLSPDAARAKRGGSDGVLLRDELGKALATFNPWLPGDAVRQIVEKLEALPRTIEGNREALAWLRGERSWYDDAERRHRSVRTIDFVTPAANALHVTWEWAFKPSGRKGNRADVVFVVNGLPVCIVEHKNPKDGDAIDRGVVQLKRYEKQTPELIGISQLFNVTHLLDYWYGVTWNANRRFMSRWKREPEESYRFAVQSFFEPADFLRTLRHWILFYVEDGETRKSVLREHQRIAVDRVVARCEDPDRSRGLLWHTQGSGKTFTLLTAARLILEDKARFGSATVMVVVDRRELEGQLGGWVERLLGEMQAQDIAVHRAGSRAELEDLIASDRRGLILSMIHKFDGIAKGANGRDGIYVFIDEAHRSVARDLGTYLMAAVPNATVVGFTGTPVGGTERGEGTFKIFGAEDEKGYLHKYSIQESIEDGTTLPIRHTMAPSEMTVPVDRLDREFFDLADAEGVTDIDELNRVLDRAVGLRTFLTADDRVEKIAEFVAKHFRENVAPLGYKAFLVGVNREACAKYKRALDRLLPAEWSEAIYTENAADVVDRPVVAEVQLSAEREADVRALFKKPRENPKILIVTDKLLTGYDAPLLYCMYLDKPMRDHVLLQAIARVNRPHVDADGNEKRVGLVVDFVGVLRELKKALRFDGDDVSGAIEDLDLLLADLVGRLAAARENYLESSDGGGADERLERLVYGRFLGPEARRAFFEAYKDIESLWEILSPSPELRDHIDAFRRLAQLYATVRNAHATGTGYTADLARKTERLVRESAAQYGLGRTIRTVTFDPDTLAALRSEEGSNEGKVFNLVRGLNREMDENAELAPVLRTLQERAERVLEGLQSRNLTGLAALEALGVLAEEKREAVRASVRSGLSARAFAVSWAFRDDEALKESNVSAQDLAWEADALLGRFPNASTSVDERRRLRAALYRPLLGLSKTARVEIVEKALAILLDNALDGEA